jgi:hypothetical protein
MDIYAFGLLRMWLLFCEETLVELGLPSVTVKIAFSKKDEEITIKVQSLKRSEQSVLYCALQLLEEKEGLRDEVRSRLRQVSKLTLAVDPNELTPDMDQIVELLYNSKDLK